VFDFASIGRFSNINKISLVNRLYIGLHGHEQKMHVYQRIVEELKIVCEIKDEDFHADMFIQIASGKKVKVVHVTANEGKTSDIGQVSVHMQ